MTNENNTNMTHETEPENQRVLTPMASIHRFTTPNPNSGAGAGGASNAGSGTGGGGTGGSISSSSGGIGQALQNITHQTTNNDVPEILVNYNKRAKAGRFQPAMFREKEIERLLGVLGTKNQPNALLVGRGGVGKTQIVEELARRLVTNDPIVKDRLGDMTIYELPIARIVSGAGIMGQLEERLYEVIDFASKKRNKCILFIDEIHMITNPSGNSAYQNLSQILKPELSRGSIRIIGATTAQEARSFNDDPAFKRRWSDVQVGELNRTQTIEILKKARQSLETHHNVLFDDSMAEVVYEYSEKYQNAKDAGAQPARALALLDRTLSEAGIERAKVVIEATKSGTLDLLLQVSPQPILNEEQVKRTAVMLVGESQKPLRERAKQLKARLSEKIMGQDSAIEKTNDAVQRLMLGLYEPKRPTSFLLAGPTGTGKTEIARQVALSLFGSAKRMIYVNMSEYENPSTITRIIGSAPGYIGSSSNKEKVFDTLTTNPRQLIVLDEFEKAHENVQKLFMQVLDNGKLELNDGVTIDFSRAIIMATTNAGVAQMTKQSVGFMSTEPASREYTAGEMVEMLKDSFPMELINRFEHILPFNSISRETYMMILGVKYNEIVKEASRLRPDLELEPKEIDVTQANTYTAIQELTDETYTPDLNARPAERSMRKYIEDTVLDNMNATKIQLL